MQDAKEKVALSSIAISSGLTVAKAIVGVLSGSLALLSEAAHSLIDVGATVMTYFAVRISGRPADAEHHYGHGKVESVSALAETALLFVLSGVVIWEALQRLIGGHGQAIAATRWAFGVIIVSVVKDITVAARYHFFLHGQSAETLRALLLLRGGPQVLVNSALVSAQVSLCVRLTNAAALGIRKSIS